MQVRVDQTRTGSVTNAVRYYDEGRRAAMLLLRPGDPQSYEALEKVFSLHGAPEADLEDGVPAVDGSIGTCAIRGDGVLVTLKGADSSLLGVRLDVPWNRTSPVWRAAAEGAGCVWLCLIAEEDYREAFVSGDSWTAGLPVMPVLKLEVPPEV